MSDVEPYFGTGTTPPKVRDAIERAVEERQSQRGRRVSTAQREAFFKRMAEEVKRAGGEL